jgi:tetratricopeptide (TPR) repeat protein
MNNNIENRNDELFNAVYLVQSSDKSGSIHNTIAIRPAILENSVQWEDGEHKVIRIEGVPETPNLNRIHVFIGDKDVVTLSKLTVDVYDRYFKNGGTHLKFKSDLSLQEHYLGIKKQEENRYAIALEKSIREHADTFSFDEYDPADPIPPQEKKEQFIEELKNSYDNPDFRNYLIQSVKVMREEGMQYLDNEAYSTLLKEFDAADKILSSMDLDEPMKENFGQFLQLSEATFNHIFDVAVAKYEEEQHPKCLSLFVLLTTLHPEEFDLWYRTGIAAQSCENYPLAINAYEIAAELNPGLIAAHLSCVECCLKLGMKIEAHEKYREAEKLDREMSERFPEDKDGRDERTVLLKYVSSLLV